ncbi:MAG: glycosyltransferase, partial [Candidatus Saccharimonadales bacterium]
MKQPRVAIVHDWLLRGGSERVVMELHKMFPDAPIYTSYCTDEWREKLDDQVITGWLQHFGKLRKFMVLGRIWWFSHLDLSEYDLVISSSGNGEAFSVYTEPPTIHVCYCHSPTHYYWRHYDEYMKNPGFGIFSPLAKLGLKLLVVPLRKWDFKAAQRPDYFVANSSHIQKDIKQYYSRDSVVIPPPTDLSRFKYPRAKERRGFIVVGRQTTYKKVDLAVAACSKLGLP